MFAARLNELKGFSAAVPSLTGAEIVSQLQNGGMSLPQDYVLFLEEFPATVRFNEEVLIEGKCPTPWAINNEDSIQVILGSDATGSDDILANLRYFREELLDDYIVIGFTNAGSSCPICMNIGIRDFGKIYAWDRTGAKEDAYKTGMYLIADSFRDFMGELHLAPDLGERSVEDSSAKLICFSVSSKLDAAIREMAAREGRKK